MSVCRQCGWPFVEAEGLCKGCLALKSNPDPLSKRTHLGTIPFQDLKQIDEADRIKTIVGHLIKNPGKKVLVLVDSGDGHQDKGDRYIRQVRQLLPGVQVVGRIPGPVDNGESIVFRYGTGKS